MWNPFKKKETPSEEPKQDNIQEQTSTDLGGGNINADISDKPFTEELDSNKQKEEKTPLVMYTEDEEFVKKLDNEIYNQLKEEASKFPDDILESFYVSGSLDTDNEELYNDPGIVGYNDREEQKIIFDNLTPVYLNLKNETLLDVGCGTGDYYAYIEEIIGFKRPHYTGIDYNSDMITIAQNKFTDVTKFFEVANFSDYSGEWDWVVAGSIFNIKYYPEDSETHLFTYIDSMLGKARKGISFNFLYKSISTEKDEEGDWVIYDFGKTVSKLHELYPDYQMIINTNYLDGDCNIQIFK